MSIEILKEGIKTKADSIPPLGSTLKFDFGADIILIDGTGDSNSISSENKDADCTLSIDKEAMQSILNGDLNPMAAVMSGKMKISGDMGVAMKLQSLFS